jgi:predicted nucleic acid-binding protein
MAVFLLDTSVIIDAINDRRDRNRLLENLLLQSNRLACCSISVTEVYAGMRPEEAAPTEAFLRALHFYEISWDIARLAGELKWTWKKKGRTLSLPDASIAAVAIAHGLTLVTDNRRDFPIAELSLYPML